MKKAVRASLGLVLVLGTVLAGSPATAEPRPVARPATWMEPLKGNVTWTPSAGSSYRKSMSVINNPDGSADMWMCAQGSPSGGTVITYRHSPDGRSWPGAETAALSPTPGGRDSAGVCHPSVVRLGGTYFMAYSGTQSPSLNQNEVFVARSTSPGGPFQKWNGTAWGPFGPQPVVYHTDDGYGAWAPSLIEKEGLLYLYYAATTDSGQQQGRPGTLAQMRLRVADVSGRTTPVDRWPERMSYAPMALTLPGETKPDGTGSGAAPDIKYSETFDEFLALGTGDPYTVRSYPVMWESGDGRSFAQAMAIRGSWRSRAGDVGLTADDRGHLSGQGGPGNIAMYSFADPGAPAGILSTYSSPVAIGALATVGAITPQQGASADNWMPTVGDWHSIDGAYTNLGTSVGISSLKTVVPDSAQVELDVRYMKTVAGASPVAGVFFGGALYATQGHAYTVYLTPDGIVSLGKTVDDREVTLASVGTGYQPGATSVHLRIVKSHANIQVFVGTTKKPFIDVTDTENPYTAGGLGVVSSNASVAFGGLSVSDNVPPTGYLAQDWMGRDGSWSWNLATGVAEQANAAGGTLTLLDTTQGYLNPGTWAGGDGAYGVTVELDPRQPESQWAGINLANPAYGNETWRNPGNGYVVFMRGNGNVGLWKGGYGQVVPDVPTPACPSAEPARLRVVKTGTNIQVYVDGALLPAINYTDTAADASLAGSFSLVSDAKATLSDVAYAGNGRVD